MKLTYNHFSVKELFGEPSFAFMVETVIGDLPNKPYNGTTMNANWVGLGWVSCIRTCPPQVLDLTWMIIFFWIYSMDA